MTTTTSSRGTVRSKDGTTIAFDAWGDGQPLHGNATEPWLIAAAHALADLLPTASLQAVEGQQHSVAADVLAPALRRFGQGQ